MATYNSNSIYGKSGIYQIVNLVTEKRYIGYASNIGVRWNGHKYDLTRNKHGNDYLQKAWDKYGSGNFEVRLIQECSKEKLCLYEDYWVKVLKTEDREFGYNLKKTDPNGKAGQSLETIEKLKIKNKGKQPSHLCKQRAKEYWNTHTKTELQELNRIEALKKVDWLELRKDHYKKVINTITGEIYESAKKAVEISGIPRSTFLHKLQGSRVNNTNYKYL